MVDCAAGGHDDAGIGPGIAGVLRKDAVQLRRAQPDHTGGADLEVGTHTHVTIDLQAAIAHQGRDHEGVRRQVVGIEQIVQLSLENTGHARAAHAVVGQACTPGILVIQLISSFEGRLTRGLHREVAGGFELNADIATVIAQPGLDRAGQPIGGDHAFVGQGTPAVLENAAFPREQLARSQGAQLRLVQRLDLEIPCAGLARVELGQGMVLHIVEHQNATGIGFGTGQGAHRCIHRHRIHSGNAHNASGGKFLFALTVGDLCTRVGAHPVAGHQRGCAHFEQGQGCRTRACGHAQRTVEGLQLKSVVGIHCDACGGIDFGVAHRGQNFISRCLIEITFRPTQFGQVQRAAIAFIPAHHVAGHGLFLVAQDTRTQGTCWRVGTQSCTGRGT